MIIANILLILSSIKYRLIDRAIFIIAIPICFVYTVKTASLINKELAMLKRRLQCL